jgi:hypothetical protein
MYEVSKPGLISEYVYTDEALDAQPGASFLYVATKTGACASCQGLVEVVVDSRVAVGCDQ